MPERVVVTGMNIISSLGLDLQTNWNNLVAGKSGVKKISLFDASENITRIAAEVPSEFEEFSRKYIKKPCRGPDDARYEDVCDLCESSCGKKRDRFRTDG